MFPMWHKRYTKGGNHTQASTHGDRGDSPLGTEGTVPFVTFGLVVAQSLPVQQ